MTGKRLVGDEKSDNRQTKTPVSSCLKVRGARVAELDAGRVVRIASERFSRTSPFQKGRDKRGWPPIHHHVCQLAETYMLTVGQFLESEIQIKLSVQGSKPASGFPL